jgi:hypothetical protein
MKTLERKEVGEMAEEYKLILDTETHHDHEIIEDKHGSIRWKENPVVRMLCDIHSLNDTILEMHELGHDKNSELYRQMYRDMGYSLSGYWEIFYWEVNNDDADSYKPNGA